MTKSYWAYNDWKAGRRRIKAKECVCRFRRHGKPSVCACGSSHPTKESK